MLLVQQRMKCALLAAAANGHIALVELLAAHGAASTVNKQDDEVTWLKQLQCNGGDLPSRCTDSAHEVMPAMSMPPPSYFDSFINP